jgi:hypothetical protein
MSNINAVLFNEKNIVFFKLYFLNADLKINGVNYFTLKAEIIREFLRSRKIIVNIDSISFDYASNELAIIFDENSRKYIRNEEKIFIFIPNKYVINRIDYKDVITKKFNFEDKISDTNSSPKTDSSENIKNRYSRSLSRFRDNENSPVNKNQSKIPRPSRTEAKSIFELTRTRVC